MLKINIYSKYFSTVKNALNVQVANECILELLLREDYYVCLAIRLD